MFSEEFVDFEQEASPSEGTIVSYCGVDQTDTQKQILKGDNFTMAISVGDSLPAVGSLARMTADGPGPVSVDELFSGKKVVLFALPGAFTPT